MHRPGPDLLYGEFVPKELTDYREPQPRLAQALSVARYTWKYGLGIFLLVRAVEGPTTGYGAVAGGLYLLADSGCDMLWALKHGYDVTREPATLAIEVPYRAGKAVYRGLRR